MRDPVRQAIGVNKIGPCLKRLKKSTLPRTICFGADSDPLERSFNVITRIACILRQQISTFNMIIKKSQDNKTNQQTICNHRKIVLNGTHSETELEIQLNTTRYTSFSFCIWSHMRGQFRLILRASLVYVFFPFSVSESTRWKQLAIHVTSNTLNTGSFV